MRLYNATNLSSHDSKIKMPIAHLEAHRRRDSPGNVKSPKLGRAIRPLSSRQQNQIHSNEQPHEGSKHVSHETYIQEPTVKVDGSFPSCCENKQSCQDLSCDASQYPRHSFSNGSKPLFHHQRQSLKNRFQLLRTLGAGTYGKVKLAVDKGTGEHVAIKYIKKTKIQEENAQAQIRREIQILSSLRHQNIVNIREVFEKKDKIVLVMDYAQGGELYDYLNNMGRLPEPEARRIFRQIVSAIHYCHQNGIVHRDLKLENIILDAEANVKIADFGLSNYYSDNNTLTTYCGSPLYASPEIVNGKPYHGPEVDVWSLGVILYTLVYGAMPFESTNLASLKQQISHGDYIQQSVPSDCDALIHHMLTANPTRRARMEDILCHWWVNHGYSLMPNDQPYDSYKKLSISPRTLAANRDSLTCTSHVIIHHSNQSSISSDSDVELDFKPNSWSERSVLQDNIDNSVSSSRNSKRGSVLCNHSSCVDEGLGSEAIPSRLLKLPPDVLEILKGCSRETLAALVSTNTTSHDCDLDNNGNKDHIHCQNIEKEVAAGELGQTSSSVFDSEKKPKKGILKRKGKFSGGDSGCVMPEDMTTQFEDMSVHESDHLPDTHNS